MTKRNHQLSERIAAWGGTIAVFAIAMSVVYAITSANTAFTPQNQPVGYVGQDEITNFTLASGNEQIFRPDYEREFWSGNLDVYPVDANGNVNFLTEPWIGGAAAQLAAQNWDSGRFIGTRDASAPSSGIAFRYASLSAAQQSSFPAGMINTTSYTGDQIVNFLRGERLNESPTGMRNRSTEANGTGGPTLGDIIHSRPFYVADTTNPTIFVGANDGMLHAFNATSGAERWAYVPSMLLKKMAKLARPYGTASNPHDYFVDGRINIRSVNISGTPTRILVGSLAAGGRGLYALNIDGSNGLTASSDTGVGGKALWEIDGDTGKLNNQTPTVATAYNNLGYTYGAPAILKVNAGGVDAVITGNGYNDNAAGNYQAYLYVINAATGQLITSVQAGTTGTATSPNGLFNPAPVDINADGKADYVYAGDLKGTLWKFDLTNTTAASWSSTALHTTSPAQPIVTTPGVALHPQGGRMVTFGTGTMFDIADTTSTGPFYAYGIWDGSFANTTMMSPTLEERSYDFNGTPIRVRRALNITTPNWSNGGHKGWQVALPSGERIAGEGSFIASKRFYFASHNPTVATSVGSGGVTGVTVDVTGSGYTAATISFSGGGGAGAVAAPVISGGKITSITVTSSGTGYTSAPTITISGDGTGATATPSLSASTVVYGENWLMELDYLTGASQDKPFLDLDDNQILNDTDRIKYISTDTVPPGASVGDPIVADSAASVPGTNGIPVGKFLGIGVMSQPILAQLAVLNTTFFNRNSDVIFPVTEVTYGVEGGHFDTDIFYNGTTGNLCTSTAGVSLPASKAIASLTVGTAGQTVNFPATLGGITVNGATIVPPLTITDIPNGTATSTNALLIQSKVGGGYTATVSGNVVTLYAPAAGSSYNGYVVNVLPGTSSPGSPGTPGSPGVAAAPSTGLITFNDKAGSTGKKTKLLNDLTGSVAITVGGTTALAGAFALGDNLKAKDVVSKLATAIGTGGVIRAYIGGNSITPTCAAQSNKTLCLVDTSGAGNGQTVSMGTLQNIGKVKVTTANTAGGSLGTPATPGTPSSGWSDFAPALTATHFSGGADAMTGVTITSNCSSKNGNSNAHIHQYDDKYDRTGVDMLNPSATSHKLSNAITSTAVKYKVLVHNQYLNPAVKLHIGDASYDSGVDFGYVSVRNYQTSAAFDIATSPTYNGTSSSTGTIGAGSPPSFKPIGSLVYNMPTDALSSKDWWGNGDVRSGLHPINPGCGGRDGATTDGNMYQPIIPPVNGVDGPGVKGWSASTNSLTSTGVRHGGALTVQIIKDTTPQSALELNDSLGRPEYGWRVKSGLHGQYVLVEYTVFWHHPDNGCYGDAGWVKSPGPDNGSSTPTSPAAGSTDPKIGNLAGTGGGSVTSVTRTVVGNVTTTTINYSSGGQAIITRIETTDASGRKVITTNTRNVDCVAAGASCAGVTEVAYQDTRKVKFGAGSDEQGQRVRTGRVSWHEIIND